MSWIVFYVSFIPSDKLENRTKIMERYRWNKMKFGVTVLGKQCSVFQIFYYQLYLEIYACIEIIWCLNVIICWNCKSYDYVKFKSNVLVSVLYEICIQTYVFHKRLTIGWVCHQQIHRTLASLYINNYPLLNIYFYSIQLQTNMKGKWMNRQKQWKLVYKSYFCRKRIRSWLL